MSIHERMVARSEREKDLLKYGRSQERERIIKLLEDAKANLREKLSEVSGDSQSETYWYSRIQQLDNYMALIKGEK